MPTLGKLELTIKINEFPTLVRTLESGWKQFDIDTGDQVVTISVKPKIFKKLEQAQENYPQWATTDLPLSAHPSNLNLQGRTNNLGIRVGR